MEFIDEVLLHQKFRSHTWIDFIAFALLSATHSGTTVGCRLICQGVIYFPSLWFLILDLNYHKRKILYLLFS